MRQDLIVSGIGGIADATSTGATEQMKTLSLAKERTKEKEVHATTAERPAMKQQIVASPSSMAAKVIETEEEITW